MWPSEAAPGSGYHRPMVDSPVIAVLQDALTRLPGLELAIVFGSVARAAEHPGSDVDLAIQTAAPLDTRLKMMLVAELADATGRAIDLIDLRTVGEPLLGQILSRGRRLLGSDEAFARLLSRHLIDAADFLPYAERIVDERRRAWIGR